MSGAERDLELSAETMRRMVEAATDRVLEQIASLPAQPAIDIAGGAELSRALRAPDHPRLLAGMYGNEPDKWRKSLSGIDRLRFITNAFTRMRYCRRNGRLDFSDTGPPGVPDSSLAPWFTLRDAGADGTRIVFGHWATLQLDAALPRDLHVRHVDTGCVWGGSLTALRLEDDREFSVGCEGGALPVPR